MKFIFDIDGTICFKGNAVTKGIIQALDVCQSRGHEIIFASARPIRDLLPVLPNHMHHYSMIGGNGAFIAKGKETIEVITFDLGTVSAIHSIIEKHSLSYLIDSHWNYSYTGSENHPIYKNIDPNQLANNVHIDEIKEVVKVVLFPDNAQKEEIMNKLKELPIRIYEHDNEGIVDISPENIDKWMGLQRLGIKEKEFVVFGNDLNDLSMFIHAKESICVGSHEVLVGHASTCLKIDEQSIVNKIIELSDLYA
ncbi:HAD-IIB family hydrolase [Bacillus sp. GX]|uniref:HAD family hydrolase n=1 Tax=Bacillus albus TaxID=2026189 RepID=A0A1J9TL30_9BACI|nr:MULTISPECIES: HAD-IIB family hydrolase [Bacillus]KMP24603.1 HAD family hydrolase [Bacillus cereus]PFB80478.1 HAD family hydrolase [Bacillus anthracis]AZQ46740.1 HAD-IIB family hydrolase [Bacillus albus]MBF7152012.1 HAD-IIB family hydrolase [Bacillus albus]MBU5217329.1 HAD family hydrolase [Bacillus albus]